MGFIGFFFEVCSSVRFYYRDYFFGFVVEWWVLIFFRFSGFRRYLFGFVVEWFEFGIFGLRLWGFWSSYRRFFRSGIVGIR